VKRFVLIASLVVGLAAVAAPVATPAAPGDAKGPACGNIVDGDGSYTGALGGAGTVDFTIQLQAPACSTVTYSFFVTDTSGAAIAANGPVTQNSTTCTLTGSAGGCVEFVYNIASSLDPVCVYATTAIKGHVVDYAPNLADPTCTGPSPAVSMALNGGSGASGNFG
jgi:hypothetical protein